MSFTRLPRFRRSSEVAPIRLTERDYNMLEEIYQHRFLRTQQIIALVGGSFQQGLRRLRLLYHHGYLERPRCQIDYYYKGGSRRMIHGLSAQGRTALLKKLNRPTKERPATRAYPSPGRIFLEHTLMISDTMVALQLACRRLTDIRIVPAQDALRASKHPKQLSWKVRAPVIGESSVAPDAMFVLRSTLPNASFEDVLYCLEADCGTMPIISSNSNRSSIARKLLAYQTTWQTQLFRQRFGFARVQILFVTTGEARLNSIFDCARADAVAPGLFLFARLSEILDDPSRYLEMLHGRLLHPENHSQSSSAVLFADSAQPTPPDIDRTKGCHPPQCRVRYQP